MNEQGTMVNQKHQQMQQPVMNLNHNMMSMSQMTQPQPQMVPMNRGYGLWPPPSHFQNNTSPAGIVKPPSTGFKKSLGPRSNWKGKKANNLNDKRRNDKQKVVMAGSVNMMEVGGSVNPNLTNYQPPTLNDLQHQNRLKTRKFFQKKKYNKHGSVNMDMGGNSNYYHGYKSAPFAPRNTTSFIIRAKKSGGIASLVSPSPMTPAILPTPIFSPSREVVVDMAKEEWGVDGYGSMKGLIRLKSPGHEIENNENDDEEDEGGGGGSSESDVEGHVDVARRFDHDLSRFEMIYNPKVNNHSVLDHHYVLENRVDDQDSRIAQLEEENLIFKERLFLMERELGDLRRRMQFLKHKDNEEMVENDFDHVTESRRSDGNKKNVHFERVVKSDDVTEADEVEIEDVEAYRASEDDKMTTEIKGQN